MDASVRPVIPRAVPPVAAVGRILAGDVILTRQPPTHLALRDGWALNAASTQDAGPYAPAPLSSAALIDAGEPMPAGADAVAEMDAVVLHGGRPQAVAPLTSGDGVLAAGTDADYGAIFVREGHRLTALAAAALAERVFVREPRVRVAAARSDRIIDAAVDLLAHAITAAGGVALLDLRGDLGASLRSKDADVVVTIGGTGSGRQDTSIATLAELGRLDAHGIAISPGETAAFGAIETRPVLMLPGRVDAVLAGWLLLGEPLLARLAGRREEPRARKTKLASKVSSSLGLAEFVPVRLQEEEAVPLGGRYLSLQTLARADGWILVPPDSEGYPAGATVMVRTMP